jgi:hypothetical protein
MKKIIFILFAFAMFACKEENVLDLKESNVLVHFPTISINETAILTSPGQIETSSIQISIIGNAPTSDLQVTVSVDENSTAVEGVHYNLPSTSVTIPAGEFGAELEYEVILDGFESPDDQRTLILTLSGNSTEGVADKDLTANIAMSISCPIPEALYGTYNVTTTETSPAGCAGVTNVVTLEPIEGSIVGVAISDVTGGLYANCYGSADNPGTISYRCGEIIMTDVEDVVYGGDVFNGSGSYNVETGELTITWSNGFGDAGTSVFVKQ